MEAIEGTEAESHESGHLIRFDLIFLCLDSFHIALCTFHLAILSANLSICPSLHKMVNEIKYLAFICFELFCSINFTIMVPYRVSALD